VWGYDYFGGTRTVDVHVRRLRAKLGPDNEALIGTVRNVGYRFVPARGGPPRPGEGGGDAEPAGLDDEDDRAGDEAGATVPFPPPGSRAARPGRSRAAGAYVER